MTMTLSDLIRGKKAATAIPATKPKDEAATVATVATVAVANPKNEKTAGADDTASGRAAAPPAPLAPLTPGERSAILGWLAAIGETNEAAIRRTLEGCERDAEVRAYFLRRAAEREGFEERAAVLEYEQGLSRQEAEGLAAAQPFTVTDAARTALRAARAAFGNPKPRE